MSVINSTQLELTLCMSLTKEPEGNFLKLYKAISDSTDLIETTIEGCDGLEFVCRFIFPSLWKPFSC